MRHRVLIVTASMGAGHDGAARELARRLGDEGHDVTTRDFLDAPPRPVGAILRSSYRMQLRYFGWTYEVMYRIWFLAPVLVLPLARFVSVLSRRRIRSWIDECRADVVVSTYPLASQALAAMAADGRVTVPTATFLTDFGIHPLWVSPHVDLHIAVHPHPAAEAERRARTRTVAPGPLVSRPFTALASAREEAAACRRRTRASMGLGPDDRAVLIVAGSWGVGRIGRTFRTVAAGGHGRYVPIVVCGRDDRLRRRLERWTARRQVRAHVLGWTDEMPALMQAADVLVENAGGLTVMEACASALPVVTYRPIPGHGRQNAGAMEAAGITRWAASPPALFEALDLLAAATPVRAEQVAAGRAMFAGDPAATIVAFADMAASRPVGAAAPATVAVARSARSAPARARRQAARALAATAMVMLAGIATNEGVSIAAAAGVGVARPVKSERDAAFLAVRMNDAALADPRVAQLLAQMHVTAVIDGTTARDDPGPVRLLAAGGVDIESGGAGGRIAPVWRRGRTDIVESRRVLGRVSGEAVPLFVPSRRVDAIDLWWAHSAHTKVVVAHVVSEPGGAGRVQLHAGHVYLVDGRTAGADDVLSTLTELRGRLDGLGIRTEPLSDLR